MQSHVLSDMHYVLYVTVIIVSLMGIALQPELVTDAQNADISATFHDVITKRKYIIIPFKALTLLRKSKRYTL